MARWEYKVLEYRVKGGIAREMHMEGNYLSELNDAGREGWELVGIIPFTENQGRLSRVHLILKKA
jgi:hypothetical protein